MHTQRSTKPLLLALLFLALAVVLVGGIEYIIQLLPPAQTGANSVDALADTRAILLMGVRGAGIVLLLLAAWRFAVAFSRALRPRSPDAAPSDFCVRCGAAGSAHTLA